MSNNDLKRKVDSMKEENEILALGIQRTRLSIKRLKLEYSVLLERLESRLEKDPELSFEKALPSLETYKKELLVKPLKKPKSKAQKAKDRDPNLPKRPTNAYLLFCEITKEKIRQSGTQDVTKGLSEAWKNLSEKDRAPFYKLYNDDRERYKREMEVYTMNNKEKKPYLMKEGSEVESEATPTPSAKTASREDIDIDIDDDEDEHDQDHDHEVDTTEHETALDDGVQQETLEDTSVNAEHANLESTPNSQGTDEEQETR